MKQTLLILLLLSTISLTTVYSQEEEIVIPYKPDEFPQWALDLRRAEIITIGSFPISFMLTALVYDISLSASTGFDTSIPYGSNRTQDDIVNMLLISGGISIVIGLADFIIQQVKYGERIKEKQKLDEQRKDQSDSS